MRHSTSRLAFRRRAGARVWHGLAAASTMLAVAAACARAPTTRMIVMTGTRFSPMVDTVSVQDTVVWKNDDLVSHTATADDRSFNSGNLDVGQAWRTEVRTRGTFAYRCLYHTGMLGTLVVR
jgi:plastocyanin